jgi:release factor glutamine methyltransferase
MPESALTAYREAQAKREKRIPVQHITGEQEFMGLSFKVTGDVLVPRQDTEILAEEALKDLSSGMRVLDLCTGSGCILLSLIALCPGITGTGTDISPRALAVAKENAERLGVSAEFFEGDLFAGAAGPFDMIVSNPPYIRTQEIETLAEEVRLFDPRGALDGGEDGLVFYRRILSECGPYLAEGGHVLLETGWDQSGDVADIMRENGFAQIRILRAGCPDHAPRKGLLIFLINTSHQRGDTLSSHHETIPSIYIYSKFAFRGSSSHRHITDSVKFDYITRCEKKQLYSQKTHNKISSDFLRKISQLIIFAVGFAFQKSIHFFN